MSRAARTPGEGAYARIEREQRFLLRGVPDGVVDPVVIDDVYVRGTTLRLRRMTVDGDVVACKLTQKVRADADDPRTVKLTTIYLRVDEYDMVMSALRAGDRLSKTRWSLTLRDGRRLAIDQFGGNHVGLVLAELELDDGDAPLDPSSLPFVATDVSGDEHYTGAALARGHA